MLILVGGINDDGSSRALCMNQINIIIIPQYILGISWEACELN